MHFHFSFHPSWAMRGLLSSTLCALACGLVAGEDQGESLIITPGSDPREVQPLPGAETHDGGQLLRDLPGVSGSRLGGMGIDPIMRGQGEGGVGVQANGCSIISGCPNRMDPATSYFHPSLFDSLLVERGLRSLAHGRPTPGGRVILERQAHLSPDGSETISGRIGAGWTSVNDGRSLNADVNAAHGPWALRCVIAANQASDYQDGNGERISAAHRSAQIAVLGAWQVSPDWLIEAEAGISDHRDVRYPGAGMDSPKSTARSLSTSITWDMGDYLLRQSQLRMHYSEVDHVMDNFSLREPPMMGPRQAPSETSSLGASWALDLGPEQVTKAGNWNLRLGLDGQRDRQDAELINVDTSVVISPMWNNVRTDTLGAYAEGLYGIMDGLRLEFALRLDWWRMQRDRHPDSPAPGGLTHDDALDNAYGSNDRSMDEVLPAAILGLQYDIHADWELRLAGSLAHRPATASEGFFMRRPGGMAEMWNLGNPTLDPERHLTLELGINGQGTWLDVEWSTSAEAFYSRVDDAIRQVRGANGSTLYDNTDIELMGAVWLGAVAYELNPSHRLIAGADASYTRGSNRDDSSGVARIAPASASLSLDWEGPAYGLGIWTRGEHRQHRVDEVRDTGPSSSWGIVGVQGHYDLTPRMRLRAGVDNLFDRAYAYHLSRSNIFDDVDNERVNEPGRSFWLTGDWRF